MAVGYSALPSAFSLQPIHLSSYINIYKKIPKGVNDRPGTFSWSNFYINTALLFVAPFGPALYKPVVRLNKIQYSLELHSVSLLGLDTVLPYNHLTKD
jgi:hypothetical protein